jgi:hypothetical protein
MSDSKMFLKPSDLERFWEKVDFDGPVPLHQPHLGPCAIWSGSGPTGYGQFYLGGRVVRPHRLAWMIATGADPGDQMVLHHCDVRLCVRFSHLFLGTHQDNMDDKVAKGRANKKLSVQQRQEMVALDGVVSARLVAQRYGVGADYVARLWRVVRGYSLSKGARSFGPRGIGNEAEELAGDSVFPEDLAEVADPNAFAVAAGTNAIGS